MHIIQAQNVNKAWGQGIRLLKQSGQPTNSRGGLCYTAPTPVMTIYHDPTERVLFHPLRDANPFFHLFEALWMLGGRNDVAFLNRYVRDFGERFGEDDGTEHDAYGHRWRSALGFDQLQCVIQRLKQNPEDRQCVIQMWDAAAHSDLTGVWKTRPCNTHVYLRVNSGALDLTVMCRSNDVIWGAYGANAVQFSVLQEYLAAQIGVKVGRLYQFSNNFHIYDHHMKQLQNVAISHDRYPMPMVPLVADPGTFDAELAEVLGWLDGGPTPKQIYNSFLSRTAIHMAMAHSAWRTKDYGLAISFANQVEATDWRIAAVEWIQRRQERDKKQASA